LVLKIIHSHHFADDKASTIEEILRLVKYPDRRINAIIYFMASGEFRVEVWEYLYLKWGHLIPLERNGKIVAAKLIINYGEDEEYLLMDRRNMLAFSTTLLTCLTAFFLLFTIRFI
jgi:hypothetical protein